MLIKLFEKFWPLKKVSEPSVRDTIEELIEENEVGEASLDPEEKMLLTNILNLRDLSAEDVMVPRADIAAIPVHIDYREILSKLTKIQHARIPVYKETLDETIGFVHVKDIFHHSNQEASFDLKTITQNVLFIAPSMRLLDLLLQMKITRTPLALVVDEYGGIDGLVTTWDIIKKFLGDLTTPDQFPLEHKMTRLGDKSIIVDARWPLVELEKEFNISLPDEEKDEIETVGGLVFYLAGHIPGKCEIIKHPSGFIFEILEVDPRRIKKLRIYKSKGQEDHGGSSQDS